jgi:hypothetical protein
MMSSSMTSAKAKSRPLFLGPLLLLLGLLWVGAAEQGILPFRQALQYGLAVVASGLIVWGLHGLRAGKWRIFSLVILLAGGAFFTVHLNYLYGDYRMAGTEPLRTLLPIYQDQLLVQIVAVSAMLLGSCLVGLLWGKLRPHGGSGSKGTKKNHRPRTAAVKSSRLIRSLRR